MTKFFEDLLKNNNVLLNLLNCTCCYGTLQRGKILKQQYSNIHLSLTTPLLPEKKTYFPYDYITGNYKIYVDYIKKHNIQIVIHDRKINQELYNACLLLMKIKPVKQYFLSTNNQDVADLQTFYYIQDVLLPYPEVMKNELNEINKRHHGLFTDVKFVDFICDLGEVTEKKKNEIVKKYKINKEKETIVVSVSTGKDVNAEKIFQWAYDNYNDKNKYNLIFIYGIYYKGKKFDNENVISTTFEDNLLSLFSLSDKIICQGSYNTLVECISLGVKEIICFPKHKKELEEVTRFKKYYLERINIINLL